MTTWQKKLMKKIRQDTIGRRRKAPAPAVEDLDPTPQVIGAFSRRRRRIHNPGVYLFLKRKKVVYVGMAKSVANRVISHEQLSGCDWIIYMLTASETERQHWEAYLIDHFRPPRNSNLHLGHLRLPESAPPIEVIERKMANL